MGLRDISNERFGRLLAIHPIIDVKLSNRTKWECKCDCGNSKQISYVQLTKTNKPTQSCGCLAKELASKRLTERLTTHGNSRTKTYRAWSDAKLRCYDKEHSEYIRYGAIGIKMSDEFFYDPAAWCSYLGEPPDTLHKWSVERINCFGDYERGNIKWALPAEQTRNQKKQRNNTSGHTGVSWHINPNGLTYVMVRWYGIDNKAHSKSYTVSKYGILEAFALACAYRDEMITELNRLGAGYSENHGK